MVSQKKRTGFLHHRHQGIVGIAGDATRDGRLIEQLERSDDGDRGHEEVAGTQERERDMAECRPGARAIDRGRFVDLARDGL